MFSPGFSIRQFLESRSGADLRELIDGASDITIISS